MPTAHELSTLFELSQTEFQDDIMEYTRCMVRVLFEEVMQEELSALLQAQPYQRKTTRAAE